ncbi:MAG: type I DNA topoisomerase [Bacteroidota bacterium]
MSKNLLIVESPAKAKTIEKILGKDFTVKSSYGHVRDLDKNGVDVENDFQPKYVVTPDKQKVVRELKDWVKKVDDVWLATDEDREGEAISWHLCEVLGLDANSTKRIVFREITAPAVKNAIQTPRTVDINLVNAQQARRVLDRLVGFELSGLLWRKVKGKLSAGRVQSVAVKLLVERERQIQDFEATPYYKVSAIFNVENDKGKVVALKAELPGKIDKETDAADFLNKSNGATFTIKDIQVRPTKRRPTAPFTTSTLQQEASRKLGFSVKRTMVSAQKLYEAGHITYMRTDSTSLSEVALQAIAQEIESKYGKQYVNTRRYKTKKDNAQEAHEAIRPTRIQNSFVPGDRDQQRLYDLIWKRTIASQMSDAQLEKTTVKIGISTLKEQLQAVGEVLKFDGFLKVYIESKDDDDEEEASGILPPLKVGQELDLREMTGTERFTRPPARFTEASLVKQLEELGIGRPSTYAPTISKIMEAGRGYVVKDSREGVERKYNVYTLKDGKVEQKKDSEITGTTKNRLYPTDMGKLVSDFLSEHFDNVMDYGFTANIEQRFDTIADGKENWRDMLGDFYVPFHADVERTMEEAERANGERILGKDPETGRTLLVRMARTGKPVAQIGAPDELAEDEKPKYANLRFNQNMETITFEEALELFELPKTLGNFEDAEVVVAIGRYGPYVKHEDSFISIPKGEDPLDLTFDRALELIKEKRKADAPVATYKSLPVTKGKGRFGPFLKWNDMFINIPKRYNPETISEPEMFELIDAKIEKEANRYIHNWEEEKISVENARWGPIIKFKKKKVNIPKKEDGKRVSSEEAALMTLEEVKEIIKAQIPDAFEKKMRKKAAPKKKAAAKKKK